MGNSSSAAARSAYVLRFALVVLVCLAFGLVLGYSTAPALKWLGKRIAAAEPSQPVSLDSYASRRTEPVISAKADSDSPFERLPLVPLVGKIVQKSDSYAIALDEGHPLLSSVRNGTHWEYCGNPQCRLCYPVAGSFASDLPDMPQGYCKRHPQSRDCKPIVVPAPKPLPKATDPPVIASAGLGVVSRETLAWVLVFVFFVAWIVSGFEVHKLRRRQVVSDFRDTVEAVGLAQVRRLVQEWLDKQGHDRCWYYPEIFTELARALDLRGVKPPQLPTLAEFKAGCERYQREQYLAELSAIHGGKVTLKPQDPTYEHPSHETAMGPQQGGPPQCVKCGAQSEGLSAPCKLTPYGVHDLGPLPQRNLGTGCVEGCRYPTLHVPGCKHDEYDRLTVARERARLHLFRAEYELESFSGYKLVAVGGQLHRMSPTQLPSVDELKSQILAAIEKRPVSPSLCVVRGLHERELRSCVCSGSVLEA